MLDFKIRVALKPSLIETANDMLKGQAQERSSYHLDTPLVQNDGACNTPNAPDEGRGQGGCARSTETPGTKAMLGRTHVVL